ncbi:MAG TPA: phosphate ABC transporter substrate-binding protein PstS [Streptosporangiaceae bacterium]
MKFQRYAGIAGVVVAGALALTACGTDNNTSPGTSKAAGNIKDCGKGTLNASGSTAQGNAMDTWRKAYQEACSGANLNYNGNGSGAGVQQFIAGSTAFAGSDSALKPEEHPKADQRCKTGSAVDLPMVVGPIAVVYNLKGVDNLQLSPKTIAGIFAGKIKTWNDPAIKKDNPSAKLPSTAISTVHRADESGTSDNFTKFMQATAPKVWTYAPGKKWVAPGGQGAKGSDGVAAAVKQGNGSIAYDEYSYAMNGKLQTAKVANGSGKFVELSPDSASKGVEAAKVVGKGKDLSLAIDYNTKEAGAYPIVLTTYEITCLKGLPADQLKLVKSFLTYTASDAGQSGLTQLGYAPLPKSIQTKVQDVVKGLA